MSAYISRPCDWEVRIGMLGGVGRVAGSVDPDTVQAALGRRGWHPLGTYLEPVPRDSPFPVERTRYVSCTDKPPN